MKKQRSVNRGVKKESQSVKKNTHSLLLPLATKLLRLLLLVPSTYSSTPPPPPTTTTTTTTTTTISS